jgi:hypothetical protein
MKWMMRYNDWQHDPLAQGNSGNAVASRFDLVNQTHVANPWLVANAFGGTDSKIASASATLQDFRAWAISGPTYYQQPVFTWDSKWANVTHLGHPTTFFFDWQFFGNEK